MTDNIITIKKKSPYFDGDREIVSARWFRPYMPGDKYLLYVLHTTVSETTPVQIARWAQVEKPLPLLDEGGNPTIVGLGLLDTVLRCGVAMSPIDAIAIFGDIVDIMAYNRGLGFLA